jgi:2-dehydro-3-deoxygalactonokinase
MASATATIALDWGTTNARAWRLDGAGAALERRNGGRGISSVPEGGFPAALTELCGDWLAAAPQAPLVLVGMVGSRNGWVEAPYAPLPCGAADLAARLLRFGTHGRTALVVPGISGEAPSGGFDVMRGEETLALGSGVRDGLVCLPGSHSKWIAMRGGRITAFASFMTGEVFAALSRHTILGRLAEQPADPAGAGLGHAAARRPGGLLHKAFAARTGVLAGSMAGAQVEPFLSALLVAEEIAGARELFGEVGEVALVAEGALAEAYCAALAAAGIAVASLAPEACFVAGVANVLAARESDA